MAPRAASSTSASSARGAARFFPQRPVEFTRRHRNLTLNFPAHNRAGLLTHIADDLPDAGITLRLPNDLKTAHRMFAPHLDAFAAGTPGHPLVAAADPLQRNAQCAIRNAQSIASNPLGKVPTPSTGDGTVPYAGRVVCASLDGLAGGTLFPRSGPARWQALTPQSLANGMLGSGLLARSADVAGGKGAAPAELACSAIRQAEHLAGGARSDPGTLTSHVDIGTAQPGPRAVLRRPALPTLNGCSTGPRGTTGAEAFGQRPSM